MARPRGIGVQLPEGVQAVRKPSGKVYFYWAPKRSTKAAGNRIALGSNPSLPEFWERLQAAQGLIPATPTGTFSKLIEDFKASPEWKRLRPASQRAYKHCLGRIETVMGKRPVVELTKPHVYQFRDAMGDKPPLANLTLGTLQTLIEFGVARGYRTDNPVIGVKRLELEGERGTRPWTEDEYAKVIKGPVDLARMAFLGRATGQRSGDLVKMRQADLEADGINVSISKLRGKRHFVPLTSDQMAEIKSWGVKDIDYFIKQTDGKAYKNADALRWRWQRWRSDAGLDDVNIHGLRALAVQDRQLGGTNDSQIADEIGMSLNMVRRYCKFADKAERARRSTREREASVVKLKPATK